MNKEKIKEWFYNNILTILSILAPAISYVLTFIMHKVGNQLSWLEILLLGILTIETIIIIIKIVWNSVSYKSYYYPGSKIKSNYEVIEKNTYYQLGEGNELIFIRSMKIKSNIDNLQSVFDKFIWTGSSPANIPEGTLHIQEIKESNRIGIWKYFQIILDTPIEKGKEREIEYEWPPIPQCTTSSPFFSTSTEEPTRKVRLHLKLGRKYAGREIILEEYRAIEGDNPICAKRVRLNQLGDYTWTIDKPKRFRYYRIRWDWSLNVQSVPAFNDLN